MRRLNLAVWLSLVWLLSPARAADRIEVVSGAKAISPPGEPLAHPVWSPSGEWIAASRPNYQGIWLLRPDGSELRQISAALGAGYRMEWAPDGKRLICRVSRRRGRGRVHAVQVIRVPEGTAQMITGWRKRLPAVPHWLGNLRAFVYTGERLEAWGIGAQGSVQALSAYVEGTYYAKGNKLYVSGRKDPIFVGPREDAYVLNVVPSPDGDRFAFEVSGGGLYVVSRDGKTVVELDAGHRPRWSPDGQWLVCFRSTDDGHRYLTSDLYALRTDGQAEVQLTDTEDVLEMDPSWSPDGDGLVYYDHRSNRIFLLRVRLR